MSESGDTVERSWKRIAWYSGIGLLDLLLVILIASLFIGCKD